MNPLDFLVNYLKTFEEGRILLSPGRYEWKIPTKGTPKQVWLSQLDADGVPVCHGKINMYGVSVLPDGFVLHAQVNTERAEIYWQAYLETSNETFSAGVV